MLSLFITGLNHLIPWESTPNKMISSCNAEYDCNKCAQSCNCSRSKINLNQFTSLSNFEPNQYEYVVMPLSINTPSNPKWILDRIHHDGPVEVHNLRNDYQTHIGRNSNADVVIPSIYCSRTQCNITVCGDTVLLTDTVNTYLLLILNRILKQTNHYILNIIYVHLSNRNRFMSFDSSRPTELS